MTDDFGLDCNDIVQNGDRHIPPTLSRWTTGDRFKAWHILQYYPKKAKPFFVQVKLACSFDDIARRNLRPL